MKEVSISKRFVALMVALVMVLSLGLIGCSAPAEESTAPAADATAPADEATAPTEPAGPKLAAEWQGFWVSKSEIVPPEQETDQYELEAQADGSFIVTDGGAPLYSGTLVITDSPEPGWGEATIDGTTVSVQLVNAQGIYKLIFNAGDDWNHDIKKVVFQR